jgi:hypothetical protein
MATKICVWLDSVVAKLAARGITREDYLAVVQNPDRRIRSRSSGRKGAIGHTSTGRRIVCWYDEVDELYIVPVTAYEPSDR